jgi:ELWxxDGT repeat protein
MESNMIPAKQCLILCLFVSLLPAAIPEPTLVGDISDNDYADSPGDARAGIVRLLAVDGVAYWTQYSEATAISLWCSHDGQAPILLHDHLRGEVLQMDRHEGAVYYAIDVRNGRTPGDANANWLQLWRSEGSPETTRLVHEFDVPDQTEQGTPRNTGIKLLSIAGDLYICVGWTHQNSNNGYYNDWGAGIDQLWRFDGADGPVVQLADFEAMGQDLSFATFVYLDGMAYGVAYLEEHGTELVRFDLARPQDGIELVHDIHPGAGSGAPDLATSRLIDGAFFFTANDGTHGRELWRCDSTSTTMVADIRPGSGSSRPNALAPYGDRIYFAATDGEHGGELWSMARDGSDAKLSLDLNPGSSGSLIRRFMRHGEHLYFTAWNAEEGRELYRYDGETAELFHVFRPGSAGLASEGRESSDNSLSVGDEYVFSGENDGLWYLGPGSEQLVRLGDVIPFTSGTSGLIASDGRLYFPAYDPQIGIELHSLPTIASSGDVLDSLSLYGALRNDELNNHHLIGGDDPSTAPGPGGGIVPTRRIDIDCPAADQAAVDGGPFQDLPASFDGLRIDDDHQLRLRILDVAELIANQ